MNDKVVAGGGGEKSEYVVLDLRAVFNNIARMVHSSFALRSHPGLEAGQVPKKKWKQSINSGAKKKEKRDKSNCIFRLFWGLMIR